MWSCIVVVGSPRPKRDTGLGQRAEQHLVEQFIPQPTVEAPDEGILHRLARRDVVPGDAALIGPCRNGVAGDGDGCIGPGPKDAPVQQVGLRTGDGGPGIRSAT